MAKAVIDPEGGAEQVEQSTTSSEPLLPEEPLNITEPPRKDFSHIFIRLYAVVFFINIGFQIIAPAQIQIYERIYCSEWYGKHPADPVAYGDDIPESMCKIPQVQQQVSTLKGWQEFFGAAPGLLVSIPLGMLTDVYGRRVLAIVTLSALFLAQVWAAGVAWFGGIIPLKTIWLGSIFTFFGGGPAGAELILVVSCSWCMYVCMYERSDVDDLVLVRSH